MIMKSVLIMTNPVRNFATLPFHVKISHAVSVALYGARAPAAASAVAARSGYAVAFMFSNAATAVKFSRLTAKKNAGRISPRLNVQ
jgi:hypothetical protein